MARRTLAQLLALPADATHFEVLGVPLGALDAPTSPLTAARREVALAAHPDRAPGNAEAAAFMARANEAYDVLADRNRRVKYLAALASTHKPCAICGGDGRRKRQRGFNRIEWLACGGCAGVGYLRKEKLK